MSVSGVLFFALLVLLALITSASPVVLHIIGIAVMVGIAAVVIGLFISAHRGNL